MKKFFLNVLERITANIIYSIGVVSVLAIIAIIMRYDKEHLWFLPIIIGGFLILLLIVVKLIIKSIKNKKKMLAEKENEITKISSNSLMLIQELYNQLDNISKDERLNWHNISYKITELNEWKVIARRLIFRLFGQQELDNFLEKINYIESRNEYCNANIGGIQAFLNEQDLYRVYLKGFLDSVEKHPELWI